MLACSAGALTPVLPHTASPQAQFAEPAGAGEGPVPRARRVRRRAGAPSPPPTSRGCLWGCGCRGVGWGCGVGVTLVVCAMIAPLAQPPPSMPCPSAAGQQAGGRRLRAAGAAPPGAHDQVQVHDRRLQGVCVWRRGQLRTLFLSGQGVHAPRWCTDAAVSFAYRSLEGTFTRARRWVCTITSARPATRATCCWSGTPPRARPLPRCSRWEAVAPPHTHTNTHTHTRSLAALAGRVCVGAAQGQGA